MTIQEITRLLDAGFTKEEILALGQDPAASREKEQNQEQEKKDPPADPETEKRLSSIEASINSLVKAFQKENLLKDRIHSNDETLEQQTDDILKSIIRPEHKRKDDK